MNDITPYEAALSCLTPRERYVVEARIQGRTFKEIGESLDYATDYARKCAFNRMGRFKNGLSIDRARQIYERAIRKLQSPWNKERVEELYER